AALSGMPAARDSHALAIVDSCRDLHLQLALAHHTSTALTLDARLFGDLALALALVADHLAHDLAEGCALNSLEPALSIAAFTGLDRRSGLGRIAVAVPTAI